MLMTGSRSKSEPRSSLRSRLMSGSRSCPRSRSWSWSMYVCVVALVSYLDYDMANKVNELSELLFADTFCHQGNSGVLCRENTEA